MEVPLGEKNEPLDSKDFSFSQWLEDNEAKKTINKIEKKQLSLTWKHLSVTGVDSRTVLGHDVVSCVNPMELISDARGSVDDITILHDLSGQVKAGEMMLVLGRPGSGCTSFLKTIANKRRSFKSVTGDVFYGNMNATESDQYRGTIIYNSEDDIHFPTLTVAQTLGFAVKNRVSRQIREKGAGAEEYQEEMLEVIPEALGISHAKGTLVGNEFVRGVSGGERKRVSIGEVMAAQGAITCWDNATRGLDASTALEFAQTCRALVDKTKAVAVVTLYQAGNGIFDLFDKVLVLDEGRQIYYGPANMAKAYFENLGFICPQGANIADFLTSSTVETERRFKAGYEHSCPKTAQELEMAYRNCDLAREMQVDTIPLEELEQETIIAKKALQDDQPNHKSPLQTSYTIGFGHQILACVQRDIQIMLGDKASFGMQQVAALIQSLCSGSLFYNLPDSSAGIFPRSGAIFYPLVFFNLSSMAEVTATFFGRPILSRHQDFSFYRPSAFVIAKMITDIPNIILQVSIFSIVYYFLIGLQLDAGKFFTFWLLTMISALMLTSLYRLIGCMFTSFDNAAKISGFYSMVMMVYGGFFIPFQTMHVWFRWIWYINPCGYAYEALLANEFSGLVLECTGAELIPNGDAYTGAQNRACTIPGATADGTQIIGEEYLQTAFAYSPAHIWRNFGICVAWWIAFTACTAIAMERANTNSSGKASIIFKRGKDNKSTSKSLRKPTDEEKQSVPIPIGSSSSSATQVPQDDDLKLARNESVFTWDHLSYTVDVPGGKRKLLDDITGWVKPGQLGALMGSSGAGKTTLLDVLAQRKDTGVITGEVLVDGRPLPVSFQRSAGYCEQMDVHEGTSTVREALIFSARLRQPADTPDQEKISYVESIIKLLELEDIQDALIGVPGAGLTIEQRKRLTIGVELAAKPSILLFLDEPTSGLDGQSSFNIVRFLRRLTEAGQAVLCTIHQPSASLFESFDTLLLLAKGGQTVYFGETGQDSSILLNYFSQNGAPCKPDVNPAEHIIDVVSGSAGGNRDWHSIWVESPEHTRMVEHIAEIKADALSKPSTLKTDDRDFATPLWTQLKLVTARQKTALWRNPTYVWNKIFLHVSSSIFAAFTFWKLGHSASDMQLLLLACFNFIFVAIGVIAQLQPLFMHYRDIFEAREKKSKMYSWVAFVSAQLIAEMPYLVICGTIYFACWYFTIGLPVKGSTSGQVFFQMILFEFLYTAIGQGIAAISPNPFFASLLNPTIIGAFFINFAGVLQPYSQLPVFWKYWMYYLNPYTYLIGGLVTQPLYDVDVVCDAKDLASFAPSNGSTCGEYMAKFFETGFGYLVDPESKTNCEYCAFKTGGEYAKTLNYNERMYGWRDTGITALFCVSTYGFVFLMMKLRSKKTKSAKSE
ncbi:hypothetical protein V494_02834 [Pseudogymnoascus sp. VKM F-4513 (FW-928)]|nr:hypothetical protein V494_02834 [Pseudogymnoascus sp. VKM F-4513 (FW-928)]